MRTTYRKRLLSKILVILGTIFFSAILLNGSGAVPLFTEAVAVTFNGCMTAFQIFVFCLAMIISNGKVFKLAFSLNITMLILALLNLLRDGFASCGAGVAFSILGCGLLYALRRYIKRLKKDEEELDRAAYTDQLTGCLNRRGLLRELAMKSEMGKNFYLIFLDLDNFKQINDTLGHEAGDELLCEVATTWNNIPSKFPFTVCRLGGDEFAIIYETTNKDVTTEFIINVLHSITMLQSNFAASVSASAGLALYDEDTSDLQQLLSYADTAMYKAKLGGKNDYYFFDQDMYQEIMKRYLTEKDLKNALKNDSFEMLYQPQYEINSHKLVGFESLIRLKNKKGEYIDTQQFINVAEKSGLIYDIDMWVMRNVMKQTRDFVILHPEIEISINVSGKHITNKGFIETVIDSLSETNFPPKNLKIEITESSYIRHIDEAAQIVQRLKILGVKTALDDFGTGYSSLNYLSKMAVDMLKIDKSFVDEILTKESDKSFVGIIIKLGHLMNCKVIAEGVEDQDQLSTLAFLGCDCVQGYVWGKPTHLEDLSNCLGENQQFPKK